MVNQGPGPRDDNGGWCCMCGAWRTADNPSEKCPVSAEMMKPARGLTHLWAYGKHKRALEIWEQDAPIRARLLAHDSL